MCMAAGGAALLTFSGLQLGQPSLARLEQAIHGGQVGVTHAGAKAGAVQLHRADMGSGAGGAGRGSRGGTAAEHLRITCGLWTGPLHGVVVWTTEERRGQAVHLLASGEVTTGGMPALILTLNSTLTTKPTPLHVCPSLPTLAPHCIAPPRPAPPRPQPRL